MPRAPSELSAVVPVDLVAQAPMPGAVVVVARTRQSPQSASLLEQRYTYRLAQVVLAAHQPMAIPAALVATLGSTKQPTQHRPLLLTALLQREALAHQQRRAAQADLLLLA
jgi:hypothetical protein